MIHNTRTRPIGLMVKEDVTVRKEEPDFFSLEEFFLTTSRINNTAQSLVDH